MDKLSDKEAALLAAARREAAARKAGVPVAKNAPAGVAVTPPQVAQEKPKPSAAERLALLMAEDRAETERRKRKMRRTGIIASSAILAIFALWVVRATRKR